MNRRLYRSDRDRVLAGVAGGMAETYDFDPALVRVLWALLILFSGGVFLILYVIMALVVPLAAEDEPAGASTDETAASAEATSTMAAGQHPQQRQPPRPERRERRGDVDRTGALVLGVLLIGVGAFFLLRQYLPEINWGQWWPIALIALGAVLLLASLSRSRSR